MPEFNAGADPSGLGPAVSLMYDSGRSKQEIEKELMIRMSKPAFRISKKKKFGNIDAEGNLLLQTDARVSFDDFHIANYKGAVDLEQIVAKARNVFKQLSYFPKLNYLSPSPRSQ